MSAVFLDASILLYSAGGPHPHRDTSRQFMARCGRTGTQQHVSAEAIQEFVFHRIRKAGRRTALDEAADLREAVIAHPLDDAVLDEALRLIETTDIRGRDAIHAATARLAGFTAIVSTDPDFDHVPGLARVGPAEWRGA